MSSPNWEYECPQYVDFTQGTGDQEDSFLDATVFINETDFDDRSENEIVLNSATATASNAITPFPSINVHPANFTDSQKIRVLTKRVSRSLNDINLIGANSQESDCQVITRGQRVPKRSISACELRGKKIMKPVTPNCLKRGKGKAKLIKTTEERELEKIAELRKQLADHLKINKEVMRKVSQKQFSVVKYVVPPNLVKPPPNFRQRGKVPNVANTSLDKKGLQVNMKNTKVDEPCSKNLPPNPSQKEQILNAAKVGLDKKRLNVNMNIKAEEPCCSKNLPPNFKQFSNAASAIPNGKNRNMVSKEPRKYGHTTETLRNTNLSAPVNTVSVKEKIKAAAAASVVAQISEDVFHLPKSVCDPSSEMFKMPVAKNAPHGGMKFFDKRKKATIPRPFSFEVDSRLNRSVLNKEENMKAEHSKSMVAESTSTESLESVKKGKAKILTKSEKPKRSKSITVAGDENRKENFSKQRTCSASERILKDNNNLNSEEKLLSRARPNAAYTFRKPFRTYDFSALLSNPPKANK